MPITFKVAPHNSNLVNNGQAIAELTPEQVLQRVWKLKGTSCKAIIQSSLKTTDRFLPNKNGFVNNVIQAYNKHHNLIIRPDDIWIAVLSQFNLYVNKNAEDLRTSFVAHEGQKHLCISADGNRFTVDWGDLAQQFGQLLEENIVDPSLREWIVPAFTTTTDDDKIVSSIMMMSTLKAYFSYGVDFECGIPSIALLGEKKDYENIYQRLSRLEEFGVEPAAFARLLGPVITEFIDAFDAVKKGISPNPAFWKKMCHYQDFGSGDPIVGGWITAFCVWNKDGGWQGGALDKLDAGLPDTTEDEGLGYRPLIFKGLRYPFLDTTMVPIGYCEVDVTVTGDGGEENCMMVAGHVGAIVTGGNGRLDTLQPAAEWFMFEKGDALPGNEYDEEDEDW